MVAMAVQGSAQEGVPIGMTLEILDLRSDMLAIYSSSTK